MDGRLGDLEQFRYHYDFDLDVSEEEQSWIFAEIQEQMKILPFAVTGECAAEGYDDNLWFGIMQKVGLSKAEIRSSVRSQLLLMFFLPLETAAVHTAVAFPMLTRLLEMLNLTDVRRFAASTAVTLLVFSLVYTAASLCLGGCGQVETAALPVSWEEVTGWKKLPGGRRIL